MNIINFYCRRRASYQGWAEVNLAGQLAPFGAALCGGSAGDSFDPEHSHAGSRGNFLIRDAVCAMYLWNGMETDRELYLRKHVGETQLGQHLRNILTSWLTCLNAWKDKRGDLVFCQRKSLECQNSKTRRWPAPKDCHGLQRQLSAHDQAAASTNCTQSSRRGGSPARTPGLPPAPVLRDIQDTQETMKEHDIENLYLFFFPSQVLPFTWKQGYLACGWICFYLFSIKSQSFPSTITQFVVMEMTIMPQTGASLHGKRQQEWMSPKMN